MNLWYIAIRSLRYYRGMHWAVALGVAAATAAITGAPLVGDSVRGSLERLALDRLGGVDEVLVGDQFFRAALAEEFAAALQETSGGGQVEPAILIHRATLQTPGTQQRRAGRVLLLGVRPGFWDLDQLRDGEAPGITQDHIGGASAEPSGDEIVINRALVSELDVRVGDRLTVRFPLGDQVTGEIPLGRREDRVRSLTDMKLIQIVPDMGLGHFQLSANQQQSFNAFVALETLQRALDQRKKINAILVGRGVPGDGSTLDAVLQPKLEDYGLSAQRVRRTFGPHDEVIFDYVQLTSQRMVWPPEAATLAMRSLADWNPQVAFTYLANTIRKARPALSEESALPVDDVGATRVAPEIPYSTVSGWDPAGPWSLWADGEDRPLAEDEIVLNAWAAQQLGVTAGDAIELDYFQPETTHGRAIEASAKFRLRAVAPWTRPARPFARGVSGVFDQRPTAANDPQLTPHVKGITDQASIDDWDPPFPFDQRRIGAADEDYWDSYRTTPKAFVSLASAQRLWGSRFGNVTAFRVSLGADTATQDLDQATLAEHVAHALAPARGAFGLKFQPVRRRALAAARGTTPFELLFLGFSFFVIAAALMLVALLFLLGVDLRARELGVLQAVGWSSRRSLTLLLREAAIVAAVGALVGGLLGRAYAWLMLAGLRTWWLDAVVTPFLQFHPTFVSLLIGILIGWLTSLAVMGWRLRQVRARAPMALLGGKTESEASYVSCRTGRRMGVGVVALLAAGVLAAAAGRWSGVAQAGAFFGCGSLVLTGSLLCLWAWLRRSAVVSRHAPAGLFAMAWRSAGRNPGRSALTMGLIAAATFLILAMSAFRLTPTIEGVGGFELVAHSDQPVYDDLDDAEVRADLTGLRDDLPGSTRIFSLRVRPGDDASCRNLYQATRPTVLGIPSSMVHYFDDPEVRGFRWAARLGQPLNPWRLLDDPSQRRSRSRQTSGTTRNGLNSGEFGDQEFFTGWSDAAPVPVVLDKNTAQFSLHLMGGVGEEFSIDYDDGQSVRYRVVGLLDNSLLQGKLLIAEAEFQRRFPTVEGYRYFLIRTNASSQAELVAGLEDRLSDVGFDVSRSRDLLAALLAVQNTYLSTFQSLGGLGLLLGSLGVVAVQLRSVIERRGELALLRAVGFTPGRLQALFICESGTLLLGGLCCGATAALVAIMPHLITGQSSLPWATVMLVLLLVTGVSVASGLYAVGRVTRAPLLAALRGNS